MKPSLGSCHLLATYETHECELPVPTAASVIFLGESYFMYPLKWNQTATNWDTRTGTQVEMRRNGFELYYTMADIDAMNA